MKSIGFSGYYGMANYGDDLFGVVSALAARHYWPSIEVRIIAPRLDCFAAAYGVPSFVPPQLYRRLDVVGLATRATTVLGNAALVDKYVYAGGSTFHSGRLDVMRILFWINRRRASYFSAIGVSIGPFETISDERATKKLLSYFEYVAVRDKRSYDVVNSFDLDVPLVLAADLAGTVPLVHKKKGVARARQLTDITVGFSPCFLIGRAREAKRYCDCFVNAVRVMSREINFHVKIICLNEHEEVGDVDLCNYAKNELAAVDVASEVVRYRNLGVLATWDEIAGLDAYFSVRLHGAITAYMCKVPFYLFEYHQKCSDFLELVGKAAGERNSLQT